MSSLCDKHIWYSSCDKAVSIPHWIYVWGWKRYVVCNRETDRAL